jgi:hypothetical protein
MDTREEVERRLRTLQGMQMSLLDELARIDEMPQDDFEVGDVLMFERRFTPRGLPYTYAAIKGPDLWYFTGSRNKRGYTWEEVLRVLESDQVDKVWWASEWTELDFS